MHPLRLSLFLLLFLAVFGMSGEADASPNSSIEEISPQVINLDVMEEVDHWRNNSYYYENHNSYNSSTHPWASNYTEPGDDWVLPPAWNLTVSSGRDSEEKQRWGPKNQAEFRMYTDGGSGSLITESYNLSELPDRTTLFLRHRYNWDNYAGYTAYNGGQVRISTNNGTNWSLLFPIGGYPGTMYDYEAYGNPLYGQPGFVHCGDCSNVSGSAGADEDKWIVSHFNLADYVDSDKVRFMFIFGMYNYQWEGDGEHWYIDEFAIAPGHIIVEFDGDSSDNESNIDTYKWNSTIDGNFGNVEDFRFTIPGEDEEFAPISIGNHTISFSVRNEDGNWSSEDYSWLMVLRNPVVDWIRTPNNLSNDDSPSLEFDMVTPAEYTAECSLDGAPWIDCGPTNNLTDLPDGNHSFAVKAVDQFGHEGNIGYWNWTIDTVAPSIAITTGPEFIISMYNLSEINITADSNVTYDCEIYVNHDEYTDICDFALDSLEGQEGKIEFRIRATDTANNTSNWSKWTWNQVFVRMKQFEGDFADYYGEGLSVLRDSSVYFSSLATDVENCTEEFAWSSNIDGLVSQERNFTYSNLTIGNHQISFAVTYSCPEGTWNFSDQRDEGWMPLKVVLKQYFEIIGVQVDNTNHTTIESLWSENETVILDVHFENKGTESDYALVFIEIAVPANSFVTLDDGTNAIMKSILQQGKDSVVAIKSISGWWGGNRDDWEGGDQTAYINEDGLITWPSGTTEYTTLSGWSIFNPLLPEWNSSTGMPEEPTDTSFLEPGEEAIHQIEINLGHPNVLPPGNYAVTVHVIPWEEYSDGYLCIGCSKRADTVIIEVEKPNLVITEVESDVKFDTLIGPGGTGYCTTIFLETHFAITQSDTVGAYRIGLLDSMGWPIGVTVGIRVDPNGTWSIDESLTTADHYNFVNTGPRTGYLNLTVVGYTLGVACIPHPDSYDFESLPPTEPQSQLLGVYNFSWAIDLEGSILESNETDNVKPITVSAYGSTSELLHRPGPVSQNTPDWEFETLSPDGAIFAVSLSNDGEYLVAGGNDRRLYLFSTSSSVPIWEIILDTEILQTDISPDGEDILVVTSSASYLFEMTEDRPDAYWTGEDEVKEGFFLNDDYFFLCYGRYSSSTYSISSALFERSSQNQVWSGIGCDRSTGAEDGEIIIAGVCASCAVKIYSIESGVPFVLPYEGASSIRWPAAITKDSVLVLGSNYGSIKMFDWRTEEEKYFFSTENEVELETWYYIDTSDVITDVTLSSNGVYFAAGTDDNMIYFFDVNSDAPVWHYYANSSINQLVISDEGDFLIATDNEGYVYAFNRFSNVPLWIYQTDGMINSIEMSSDGGQIVIGDEYGKVYYFAQDVTFSNEPPVASAGKDIEVQVGESVEFNGTGTDPDGSIIKYEWDFDGDGIFDWDSVSDGNTEWTYLKNGTFVATLRVTDNYGGTDTDSRTIAAGMKLPVDKPADEDINEILGFDPMILVIAVLALIGSAAVVMFRKKTVDPSPVQPYPEPIAKPEQVEKKRIKPKKKKVTKSFESRAELVPIECPACGAKMKVPKLDEMQEVSCKECGLSGEIEI